MGDGNDDEWVVSEQGFRHRSRASAARQMKRAMMTENVHAHTHTHTEQGNRSTHRSEKNVEEKKKKKTRFTHAGTMQTVTAERCSCPAYRIHQTPHNLHLEERRTHMKGHPVPLEVSDTPHTTCVTSSAKARAVCLPNSFSLHHWKQAGLASQTVRYTRHRGFYTFAQ